MVKTSGGGKSTLRLGAAIREPSDAVKNGYVQFEKEPSNKKIWNRYVNDYSSLSLRMKGIHQI